MHSVHSGSICASVGTHLTGGGGGGGADFSNSNRGRVSKSGVQNTVHTTTSLAEHLIHDHNRFPRPSWHLPDLGTIRPPPFPQFRFRFRFLVSYLLTVLYCILCRLWVAGCVFVIPAGAGDILCSSAPLCCVRGCCFHPRHAHPARTPSFAWPAGRLAGYVDVFSTLAGRRPARDAPASPWPACLYCTVHTRRQSLVGIHSLTAQRRSIAIPARLGSARLRKRSCIPFPLLNAPSLFTSRVLAKQRRAPDFGTGFFFFSFCAGRCGLPLPLAERSVPGPFALGLWEDIWVGEWVGGLLGCVGRQTLGRV